MKKFCILLLTTSLVSLFCYNRIFAVSTNSQEQAKENELILKYTINDQNKFRQLRKIRNSNSTEIDTLVNSVIANLGSKFKKTYIEDGVKFKELFKQSKIKTNKKFVLVEMADSDLQIKRINQLKTRNLGFEVEAYPNSIYKTQATANDPLVNQQYALEQINYEQAWDKSLGAGVVVAVVDSGIDIDHQDLKDNIWTNEGEIPNNGIDDDGNGFIDDVHGWDFVSNVTSSCVKEEDCSERDNDPSDVLGHGTHVAGIIAASRNNSIGIAGIAPEAKLMPVRVVYSAGKAGFIQTVDLLDAFAYVIDNDADIINMSFAKSNYDLLADIVDIANQAGIIMVAAAGNSGSHKELFPAGLEKVIAVGATNEDNARAGFSNFGQYLDIVAPGNNVLSTIPGDQYTTFSGTSMSTPYVAGVAALIRAKDKLRRLSPQEVKERIVNSSLESGFTYQVPAANPIAVQSFNVNSLNAAFEFPLEVDQMLVPVEAFKSEPITFTGSGSDFDSEIVGYEWRSSKDGFLSDKASFSTVSLSKGTHTISLQVINETGEKSAALNKELKILKQKFNPDAIPLRIIKKSKKLIARTSNIKKPIQEYIWNSDLDGKLDNAKKIKRKSLSQGAHLITLQVRDANGELSETISRVIRIR